MTAKLIVVAALIVLIVLHELGHFLAARAVGIRATKFYVFFPPALFKRRVGDVEYGIGAIPAGGFVKLPGMFEPEPHDVGKRLRWLLEPIETVAGADDQLALSATRRAIVHASSADELVAPLHDLRDALTRLNAGIDTSRARDHVDALLDDLHPNAYWRAALWRRMCVIAAGPTVNFVIAAVVLFGFFWLHNPTYEMSRPFQLPKVEHGSPAWEAGLRTSSKISGWNGSVVGLSLQQLDERFQRSVGKPVLVTWRDKRGDSHTKRIVPARLDSSSSKKRIGVYLPDESGISYRIAGHHREPIGWAAKVTASDMMNMTWGNLSRLPLIFVDKQTRQDVHALPGIVNVAQEVDRAGQLVRYVALLSLVLAIMNALPLLPLDGGHLLFGLLERLRRGRPMPKAAFERYSVVGLALVLVLFAIGVNNDIASFTR